MDGRRAGVFVLNLFSIKWRSAHVNAWENRYTQAHRSFRISQNGARANENGIEHVLKLLFWGLPHDFGKGGGRVGGPQNG